MRSKPDLHRRETEKLELKDSQAGKPNLHWRVESLTCTDNQNSSPARNHGVMVGS